MDRPPDNNVAEYVALLEALQCALSLRAKALHVYSDSEVMVRQMRGEYNCRCPRLYSLNWCVLPRCWLPRRSWRLEHNQCHGPFHFCCSSPSTSRSGNVSCLLPHSYHAGSGRPLSAKPRVSFSRNSSRSKLLPPADVERSTSGASLHADHQGALIIRRKFLDALSGQFVCHVEGLPGRFRSSSLYGVAFRSLPLATTPLYLKSRSGVGKPVDSRFSVGAPLQDRYY